MQSIKLNLIPGSVLPVVNVSQYDAHRQFQLVVYEGATSYSLTGKEVEIRGTKPDGNGFAYDAQDGVVSVSNNVVTISTTQQMTAVGGQTMAELRITSGDTILGTLNFIIDVEPSALSDDTPISETEIPAIERQLEELVEEIQVYTEDAEAWAVGERDGEPVPSSDPAYQNNAKHYAGDAESDALKAEGYGVGEQNGIPVTSGSPYYNFNANYFNGQANQNRLTSEGYAIGRQNGVPVTSGSPYYHNNSFYYSLNAEDSATNAGQSATNAGLSETAAGNSATAAAADSLEAEGWAVGEQGGTPVGPTSPYYQNNAAYYATQAGQYATGGLIFKGSVAFANIPTTGMVNGDMYNITDDFTTDSRFIEGAGVAVKAGADIAYVAGSVNKWDILATGGGGADALDDLTDVDLSSPADGDLLQYDPTSEKWVNSAKIPQKVAGLQKTGCMNILRNELISQTVGGITYTVGADGIITANGTQTGGDGGIEVNTTQWFKKGMYKLVGCPNDASGCSLRISNGFDQYVTDTGNGAIASLASDGVRAIYCYIKIQNGTTLNNAVFKPMLTPDLSATYDDYQPYSMTNRELTEAVTDLSSINTLQFMEPTRTADAKAYASTLSNTSAVLIAGNGSGYTGDIPSEASIYKTGLFLIISRGTDRNIFALAANRGIASTRYADGTWSAWKEMLFTDV